MSKFLQIVINLFILLSNGLADEIIGKPCTVQSSNSPGTCKLLTKCQAVRDEVVFTQKLPQVCAFQGTQPIVCCPKFRRPGDVSAKKCREYASLIEEKSQCDHRIVKRIVGGVPAGRTEFPHMVILGFDSADGSMRWLCGGSIISEQYVLTVAHCLSAANYGHPKMVLLGITNLNDTDHRQEIKIVERVAYPEYNNRSFYNDIGLLRLEKPIEFNSYVHPACLHTTLDIHTTNAVATGWGATEFEATKSNALLKVTLEIVDHQFCNQTYGINRKLKQGIINDMHICTGRGTERKDTCQGDTGGPLQIRHNSDDASCMYDIIGITSFGKGCFGGPSISTRVSHYVKWIEDIVWPEKTQ